MDSLHTFSSVSNTITASKALSTVSIVASNTVVEQGQSESITFSYQNGVPNYVANIIVTNAVNGNVIANVINSGISATSNVLTFTVPSTNDAQGTLNVVLET